MTKITSPLRTITRSFHALVIFAFCIAVATSLTACKSKTPRDRTKKPPTAEPQISVEEPTPQGGSDNHGEKIRFGTPEQAKKVIKEVLLGFTDNKRNPIFNLMTHFKYDLPVDEGTWSAEDPELVATYRILQKIHWPEQERIRALKEEEMDALFYFVDIVGGAPAFQEKIAKIQDERTRLENFTPITYLKQSKIDYRMAHCDGHNHEQAHASVDKLEIGATICFSLTEISKDVPLGSLRTEITGLLIHELAHMAGYKEVDAERVQNFYANHLDIAFGADSTRETLDRLVDGFYNIFSAYAEVFVKLEDDPLQGNVLHGYPYTPIGQLDFFIGAIPKKGAPNVQVRGEEELKELQKAFATIKSLSSQIDYEVKNLRAELKKSDKSKIDQGTVNMARSVIKHSQPEIEEGFARVHTSLVKYFDVTRKDHWSRNFSLHYEKQKFKTRPNHIKSTNEK